MQTIYDLFAVVDDDEGLFYETLDDTPAEAVGAIDDTRKDAELRLRALTGKIRVRRVRVEVLELADDVAAS